MQVLTEEKSRKMLRY